MTSSCGAPRRRGAPVLDGPGRVPTPIAGQAVRGPVAELFGGDLARSTAAFGVASFMGLLRASGLNSWLPEFLRTSGYDLGAALALLIALNTGGFVGLLAVGRVAARSEPAGYASSGSACRHWPWPSWRSGCPCPSRSPECWRPGSSCSAHLPWSSRGSAGSTRPMPVAPRRAPRPARRPDRDVEQPTHRRCAAECGHHLPLGDLRLRRRRRRRGTRLARRGDDPRGSGTLAGGSGKL